MRLSFLGIFLLMCCIVNVNAQGGLNNLFGITSKNDPIGKLAPTLPGSESGLAGIQLNDSYLAVLKLYGVPDWVSTTRPNEGPADVMQILEPPIGPKITVVIPEIPTMSYSSYVETYKEILNILGQKIPPKPLVPLPSTGGVGPDGNPIPIEYDPDPEVTIEWKKTTMPLPIQSKKFADFYLSQYNGGVGMPEIVIVDTASTDPNAPRPAMRPPANTPAAPPPTPSDAPGSGDKSPTAPGFTRPAGIANFKWVYQGNNTPHPGTGSPEWLTYIEAMVQDDAIANILQKSQRIDEGSHLVYSFLWVPNIILWEYDSPGWKTYVNINKVDGHVLGITVVAVNPEVVPTFKGSDGSIQRTQLTSGVSFGSLISSVVDHFRYGWPSGGLMWHGNFLVLHYPNKNVTMTFGTQTGSRLRRITSITVGRAYHLTQYPTDEVKPKPKVENKAAGPDDLNGGAARSGPANPAGPGGNTASPGLNDEGPHGEPGNPGGLPPLPIRRN